MGCIAGSNLGVFVNALFPIKELTVGERLAILKEKTLSRTQAFERGLTHSSAQALTKLPTELAQQIRCEILERSIRFLIGGRTKNGINKVELCIKSIALSLKDAHFAATNLAHKTGHYSRQTSKLTSLTK